MRWVIFALSVCAWGQDVRKLTILHSNDLHARLLPDDKGRGGFAYLATVVRQERAGCGHCLYLNAGDLVQGTPVSTLFKGTPVYEIANRLKFDVSTLGNHEFDYGWQQIPVFLKTAKFPVVSANVVNDEGKLLAPRPYWIRKVNGVRVGVIGAVMENLVSSFLRKGAAGPWHVSPVVETVRRYAQELQGKVDVVVLLGHVLNEEGAAVLSQVPEVAVIILGHTHTGYEFHTRQGRISTGCEGYGINLCRLDLEVNVREKKLVSWKSKKIAVDSTKTAAAKDVQKPIAKWEKKVAAVVDMEIGEARRAFDKKELVPVIEQATLEMMKADFTYMNSGGVRDVLPKGKILVRNFWNIMPFDNSMLVAKVRGDRVPQALRNGRVLDPSREYRIAVSDFVGGSASSLKRLGLESVVFEDTGVMFRDMLIDWVKKKRVLE